MKVSELTGAALDWAVAKCEQFVEDEFEPSENWADGGPIIEREKIGLKYTGAAMEFVAWVNGELSTVHDHYGPTPLVAAMRCYVAMKMGDEIELPEELR